MYMQILLTFVGVLLYLLYQKRKRQFRFFKNLGIPGPEPSILFGNFLEIFRKGTIECQSRWVKNYGKILGYYYGTKPILLVTDLDLLKNVLLKDFQNFADKAFIFREVQTTFNSNDRTSLQILNLRGKAWKEIRSLISPSFTTSKMKQMAPIMMGCIDILLENIEEKRVSGEAIELYGLYKRLTMDVIVQTAFGIQANVQRNPNDPFIKLASLLFGAPFRFFYLLITSSFAVITPLFDFVRKLREAAANEGHNPVEELLDRCEAIVKKRMNDPSLRRVDLLQLLIDAEDKGEDSDEALTAGNDDEKQDPGNSNVADSKKNKKKRLTIDEVVANTFAFLLGGYETTSTALAFTTMMFVIYPDVQEKIRAEVNSLLEKEGKLDYGSINQLEYLDQVFCEILRLYPPIYQAVTRIAMEDAVYGNIRIPKGTCVQAATFVLHRDPELWPEPEEFNPERFAPENRKKRNPLAWQPFGAGPRSCIGMRFAQMQAKLAIAKILHKYRFLPTEKTDKHPFELNISAAIMRPKYGVPIRVEKI